MLGQSSIIVVKVEHKKNNTTVALHLFEFKCADMLALISDHSISFSFTDFSLKGQEQAVIICNHDWWKTRFIIVHSNLKSVIIIIIMYEICYLSVSIRFIRRGSSPKSSLLALYTFWQKRHPFRIPSKFYKLTNGTRIAYLVYNVYCCKYKRLFRGTQREYSSKPLKHSIAEHILVFKP